mmetsp:Transcript_14066/g.14171  ORF Transcript_14066/g.14171 Transcript_14066/m.14171 type:complete len:101 (+) Transcript_14066:324-626(+)
MSSSKRESPLLSKEEWTNFFMKAPCVKSSYLWGIASGSLMLAHKSALYKGYMTHAWSSAVLTFLFVSSVSFIQCSNNLQERKGSVQEALKVRGKREREIK